MASFPKKDIVNSLKKYQIFPKKRLGQHFLVDKRALQKIIRAADLKKNDIVLEVGPGTGVLTKELAKKAQKVFAIEKDPGMAIILKETIKNFKNVKIIQGDILKIKNGSMAEWLNGSNYKLVANLPYYIVSPVIRKFLESSNPPKLMVLMVQKEVAQRICAKPPHMSLLSVSVQFHAKPKIISYIAKKSFWPSPKVDSAIIKITPKRIRQRPGLGKLFFKIVKAGFSQPRKQLLNNFSLLRQDFGGQAKKSKLDREKIKNWLIKNKIRPEQRAESLFLSDWVRLVKTLPFS